MTVEPNWRRRARAALEAYFERRSFPRTMLSLLLTITGLCGFLISYALLRFGVDHMWLRYPIAVVLAYGILLGLIRAWVELERSRFDPDDAEIKLAVARGEETGRDQHHFQPRDSWLDWLNFPDFGAFDFDEGCLPVILVAVVLALAAVLIATVAGAPLLIAEVFLDAFLISVLYRRLRIAAREHWLGTAIRKTWGAVLVTVVAFALGGWALEQMAPGARSIGRAIEQIRTGTR